MDPQKQRLVSLSVEASVSAAARGTRERLELEGRSPVWRWIFLAVISSAVWGNPGAATGSNLQVSGDQQRSLMTWKRKFQEEDS